MDIFEVLQSAADEQKAAEMAAYMKNKFPFLGISKPERAALAKDFLKQKKAEKRIDWAFAEACYAKPQREYHYLALDYLGMMQGFLTAGDLPRIEALITTHSWWDSVDTLDALIGHLYLTYPETRDTIERYMDSGNLWLRRVSINFQQKFKEKTCTRVLAQAIEHNLGTGEFFIDKAIGWALREYAKVNRPWVQDFVSGHKLSPLSYREATKHF